jgi:hypothetical protein
MVLCDGEPLGVIACIASIAGLRERAAAPGLVSVPARRGSYPGTTAEDVARELGKPRGDGRNIIGMFAVDSLRDAIDQGAVGPDADGVLEVRV